MIRLLVTLLAAAPASPSPSPAECESPPTRDVAALQTFAQKSGALSVGLDSIATWCFDSGGEWTAGSKLDGKKVNPAATPVGDCGRALTSCESAKAAVTPELKMLLADSLADLDRPFLQKKYVPKRTGLADRPSDVVDCKSHNRADLFAQAQARMDLARLSSQAFNEYTNYKTWLFSEGLKCKQAANAGVVDNTQRNMAVDAPAAVVPNPDKSKTVVVQTPPELPSTSRVVVTGPPPDAGASVVAVVTVLDAGVTAAAKTQVVALAADPLPKAVLPVGGPSIERERINALPPVEKWTALSQVRGKLELDRDYTVGFLASRELRDCRCQRPNPAGLARRYAQNDNVPQLEADDGKNVACELCLQDAFASWKVRVEKQCLLVDKLSDFEIGVLQRSDDGNGLPPRCFDAASARRDAGSASISVATQSRDGGFSRVVISGPAAPSSSPQLGVVAATGGTVVARPLVNPMQAVATPLADTFSRAQDWAPIPLREDGRLYVRLFMSSACAADVLPGPIQARTGDLLMIPYNARQLSVRSPCGGLAEVYWGREAKPRVSEIFARNQPLHLQFQPQ